jgi:hypothetical protein
VATLSYHAAKLTSLKVGEEEKSIVMAFLMSKRSPSAYSLHFFLKTAAAPPTVPNPSPAPNPSSS